MVWFNHRSSINNNNGALIMNNQSVNQTVQPTQQPLTDLVAKLLPTWNINQIQAYIFVAEVMLGSSCDIVLMKAIDTMKAELERKLSLPKFLHKGNMYTLEELVEGLEYTTVWENEA